ncbi:hypothetical protein C8J56DRAFT_898192 [Mycena floridula]|nr:hypothetical protein C8J56DRAFT_898192 [Mycena floridula]
MPEHLQLKHPEYHCPGANLVLQPSETPLSLLSQSLWEEIRMDEREEERLRIPAAHWWPKFEGIEKRGLDGEDINEGPAKKKKPSQNEPGDEAVSLLQDHRVVTDNDIVYEIG